MLSCIGELIDVILRLTLDVVEPANLYAIRLDVSAKSNFNRNWSSVSTSDSQYVPHSDG